MLDARERELLGDVIRSVRTVANHLISVHLHLGAIRSLLIRHGTITESEYTAAVTALETTSAADEMLSRGAATVEEAFEDLLRRLEGLNNNSDNPGLARPECMTPLAPGQERQPARCFTLETLTGGQPSRSVRQRCS